MLLPIDIPRKVSFSRNEIIFAVQATDDNGLPHAAQSASCLAYNGSRFSDGDSIIISWGEPNGVTDSQIFTASDGPSDDAEFPADNFVGTDDEYWDAVALVIQSHADIAWRFNVSREIYASVSGVQEGIRITCRESSDEWTVTASGFSGVQNFNYKEATFPANYNVIVELIFQRSIDEGFEKVARLKGYPDTLGNCVFDLSSILNAELKDTMSEPPIPELGNNHPYLIQNARRYQIRYTERHGSPAADQDWRYITTRNVIIGGESIERNRNCDFFDELNNNNSLLTWYPDGKQISHNTPEYLPWFNHTGGNAAVYLRVQTFNAVSEIPNTFTYFNNDSSPFAKPYDTVMVPVGFNQLDLAGINQDIAKYTCQLFYTHNDTAASQIRTFYVDTMHRECLRHIFYLNSFNIPQTLRLTGQRKKSLKINRQKSRRIIRAQDSLLIGENFQYDFDYDMEYTYRSGYLSRNEVEALQELLIFNRVYEIYADGYRRLDLTEKKYNITECLQLLHSVSFKAVPSIQLRGYSNYVIPCADTNKCGPENWQEPSGECWETSDDLKWTEA